MVVPVFQETVPFTGPHGGSECSQPARALVRNASSGAPPRLLNPGSPVSGI